MCPRMLPGFIGLLEFKSQSSTKIHRQNQVSEIVITFSKPLSFVVCLALVEPRIWSLLSTMKVTMLLSFVYKTLNEYNYYGKLILRISDF